VVHLAVLRERELLQDVCNIWVQSGIKVLSTECAICGWCLRIGDNLKYRLGKDHPIPKIHEINENTMELGTRHAFNEKTLIVVMHLNIFDVCDISDTGGIEFSVIR